MSKWIKQNVTKLLKLRLNQNEVENVDKAIYNQNQTKSIILRFRLDDGIFAYGSLGGNGIPLNVREILNNKAVDEVEYDSSFREPVIVRSERISELDDSLREQLKQISQQ